MSSVGESPRRSKGNRSQIPFWCHCKSDTLQKEIYTMTGFAIQVKLHPLAPSPSDITRGFFSQRLLLLLSISCPVLTQFPTGILPNSHLKGLAVRIRQLLISPACVSHCPFVSPLCHQSLQSSLLLPLQYTSAQWVVLEDACTWEAKITFLMLHRKLFWSKSSYLGDSEGAYHTVSFLMLKLDFSNGFSMVGGNNDNSHKRGHKF